MLPNGGDPRRAFARSAALAGVAANTPATRRALATSCVSTTLSAEIFQARRSASPPDTLAAHHE